MPRSSLKKKGHLCPTSACRVPPAFENWFFQLFVLFSWRTWGAPVLLFERNSIAKMCLRCIHSNFVFEGTWKNKLGEKIRTTVSATPRTCGVVWQENYIGDL